MTDELCTVCLRAPATAGNLCDDCRPHWQTDAPTWLGEALTRGNGRSDTKRAGQRTSPRWGEFV